MIHRILWTIAIVCLMGAALSAEPIAFHEMGAYAPLLQNIASDATKVREAEFIRSCRGRLLQRVDRTESTSELLNRFAGEFDESRVAPETRLCLLTLIVNREQMMRGDDFARAEKLIAGLKFENPALRSLLLYARATLARHHAFGKENDYEPKAELISLIRENHDAGWLRDNPELELRLHSLFTLSPNNPCGASRDLACIRRFMDFLENIPESKRTYAEQFTLGCHYVKEAWRERGSAWAHETTPAQFEGFRRNLNKAGPLLRAAHAMRPDDVRPLIQLMTISMADTRAAGGDTAHWMDLARKANRDDHAIYERFAASNMLRWSGSEANIRECYQELLNCGDYDSFKAGASRDVMIALIQDLGGAERRAAIIRLARDFAPVANEYIRRYNETGRALIGARGQPIDFRAIALALLADADLLAESSFIRPYTRPGFEDDSDLTVDPYRIEHGGHTFSRALVCAESGDFNLIEEGLRTARTKKHSGSSEITPEAQQADDREDIGRHADPDWLAGYGARLETMSTKVNSPAAKAFMRDMIELNRIERDFQAGKTVFIPFKPNFWEPARWIGSFNGDSALAQHEVIPWFDHYATLNAYLKPPYEISVRINSIRYSKWPHVGVFVGRCVSGDTGRAFILESDTGRTYSMPPNCGLDKAKFRTDIRKVDRVATLKVRVFPHGYSVALDDYPRTAVRDDGFIPYKISIGALPGFSAYGRFEYTNMTVRKIADSEFSAEESSWMNAPVIGKKHGLDW